MSEVESKAAPEQHLGIEETMDVLNFAEYTSVKIVKALKDGIGFEDFQLLLDKEIYLKGKAAIENHKQIPAEIKDLDLNEGGQIAAKGVEMAKNIGAALKE